ncbi:MAG: glycosyltransferase family 1 protein, partial [Clostridiales bacterium]|nr:glycosyltransferase family 1 protein [Clostridiales bacterium]
MINVLHIISNGIKRDGITNTFIELISNIDDENFRIDIAAVHNDDIDVIREIEEFGCKVIKLPDRQSNILKYCLELFTQLRKGKYQAIHVHGSSSLLFIDLFIAKCAGVKKRIAHSRNTTNHYKKLDKLIRPLFHMTYTKALACGKDAGEFLFGNRKFTVIYNGKDFEKFKYDQERRLLVRSNLMVGNSILLGFVGSLNDQKNPLFLIDILSYLVKEDVDVKLIIIGDGSRRQEVEKYSEELDVFEHVIFAGRVSNVDRLLHAVDIMLLP